MKSCLIAFGMAGLLAAQTPPASSPDMCAPPPGATAPSLPAKILEGQGSVTFPITTSSPEAQRFFNQGVAQMHSFWAREAERSFLQAAQLDPAAPMPWWGVAMVAAGDWRPRFQLDGDDRRQPAKSRALDAIRKAQELSRAPGKATELERLYIDAVAKRRDPKLRHPDDEFVKSLRVLSKRYPKEVEARTYLSLILMRGFTTPAKEPRNATSMEAVAILRDLLREAPEHPGVHHYVIHGWEGSTFAKDAWPSCERYGKLTTNIPHALHMPGHIYSQTGKWEEGIKVFEDAKANELAYMDADTLYGNLHHGHNVHYLSRSYSFHGQHDRAVETARGLLAMKENPREVKQDDNLRTAYMQGWFALLSTLVQFEKWDLILDNQTLPVSSKPRQKAWHHWARGVAFANKRDHAAAKAEFQKMVAAMRGLKHQELAVARAELKGQIEIAEGNVDKGLRTLRAASAAERKLRYQEPPAYPRPVAESMGRLALAAGKAAVAEKAFRTALEQFPADAHAAAGLRALNKSTSDAGL
jgi:tetratricopeptide (TPR) repeat protein